MRLSNRLVWNAITSSLRLGVTFALGIFLTWYTVDQVGLAGLGVIGLAMGTFCVSGAHLAIKQSVVRELSAALAHGGDEELQRTLASGMGFCALAAVGIVLLYAIFAGMAVVGFFRAPPNLVRGLTILLLAEGAVAGGRMLFAPYTQTIFAARRIGLDNLLVLGERLVLITAAIVGFSVMAGEGTVGEKLLAYGIARVALTWIDIAVEILVAKRLLPGLRLRRAAFDRGEFRSIAGTVWHTGQMTLLAQASPKFIMVIINLMFGLNFNGVWAIVTQVGGHVKMAAETILRGIDPIATYLKQQGGHESIQRLMTAAIRIQLLTVLPLACCYALFMHPLLELWIGGRLARDAGLAAAGIGVPEALRLTTTTSILMLAAESIRIAIRGVERTLYGLGEVRSYAWYAKYSAVMSTGGAALLMWWQGSPAPAPIAMAAANVLFVVVVLRSARRQAGLPLGRVLPEALARPVLVALILLAPLLWIRPRIASLEPWSLVVLVGGVGLVFAPAVAFVGLRPDERKRLVEITRGLASRLSGRGAEVE